MHLSALPASVPQRPKATVMLICIFPALSTTPQHTGHLNAVGWIEQNQQYKPETHSLHLVQILNKEESDWSQPFSCETIISLEQSYGELRWPLTFRPPSPWDSSRLNCLIEESRWQSELGGESSPLCLSGLGARCALSCQASIIISDSTVLIWLRKGAKPCPTQPCPGELLK